MSQTIRFMFMIFSTMFAALQAVAAELDLSKQEEEWLHQHSFIELGVDPDWPPFEFVDSEGIYQGIAADYMQLVRQRLGVTFKHVPDLSWSDVISGVQQKRLSILPAIMKTDQREQYLNFTKSYLDFPMVILVRQDEPLVSDLATLYGKNVAVVRNYVTHELLARDHPQIKLWPLPTIYEGLEALSTGVVDAYIGNLASISFAINKRGITNLKIVAATSYSYPLSIGVRKDWPELIPILQKALDSITASEVQAIKQKWIQINYDRGVDSKTVLLVALPVIAIVLTFVIVSVYKNKRLKYEITERLNSEEKYRTLFESANDSILILQGNRFIDCNPVALTMFACEKDDLIGKTPEDFSPFYQPDGESSIDKAKRLSSAAKTGEPQHFEWQHKRLDGKLFDADVTLNTIEIGGAEFLQGIIRDVTERKIVERELAHLLNEYDSVTNNIPDLLYKTDNEGRFVWWNKGFEYATGLSPKELSGQSTLIVVYEEDYPIVRKFINKINVTGRATAEFRILTVNGPALYQVKSIALKDEDGKITGRTGVARDISQQRKTEKVLKTIAEGTSLLTGQDFFYALVGQLAKILNVRYAFVAELVDDDKRVMRSIALWSDGQAGENFEYLLTDTPCETVVGRETCVYSSGVQHLFPDDNFLAGMRVDSYAGVSLFGNNGETMGILVVLDDRPLGDELIVRSVINSFAVRASVELERIRTENKLRQAAVVFENSDEGFMITDADNNIIAVNRAFSEITGYSESEVIGKNPRVLSSSKQDKVFYQEMWHSLQTSDKWQGQIWNQRKNGELFPEWLTISLMKDDKGNVINYVGVFSDISKHVAAEEKQRELQSQLQQAQKMEAIGQLTGGIAHDFNNMLASILGYTDLAKTLAVKTEGGKLYEYLNEVTRAGERARDLVAQMLTFSRGRIQNEKTPMVLGPIVKEAVKMLRPMLPSSIEISNSTKDDLPLANVDPLQLHQLIMNLCINARDAMSDKGRIDVNLFSKSRFSGKCSSCHQPFSGNFLEISVRDNGTGIDRQYMDQLFEPFFTTKEIGKGTGMGLSLVHGICHTHGGHVVVESEMGKGATFRALFPYLEDFAQQASQSAEVFTDVIEGQNQHILVVDDEEAIAGFMKVLLEGCKYRVSTFTDCQQAMANFLQDPECYDLVITDQTMPIMTGEELARSMLQVRPDLPIILCTGYSNYVDKKYAKNIGVKAYMEKPVNSQDIVRTISSLLN